MRPGDYALRILFPVQLALIGIGSLGAGEMTGVADPSGRTMWYDCRHLAVEGRGWTNTESFYDRLPSDSKGKIPDAVWNLGHDSAGMCVRFTTDADSVQVRWILLSGRLAMAHMPATGVSGVDLYTREGEGRWRFTGNGRPTAVTNNVTFAVRPGAENLLYLPMTWA